MTNFLKTNRIVGILRYQILNMLHFWWYYNRNAEIFGKDGILVDAAPELKDKIVTQRISSCLEKIPLFEKCHEKLLHMVTKVASTKTLPAGAVLVTADNRPTLLYVIIRGFCEMKSTMAGDRERDQVTTLKAGDAFPVVEVLHQVLSLISVTTVTAVEVIIIKYSDLQEIFLANRELGKITLTALEYHLKVYNAPLLRKKGRLPEMIPAEHSLGQGDYFTYEIYDDKDINPEETAYLKPFKKLGKFAFVRYFLLRKTIYPESRFFICWEIFRCIFAVSTVFLSLAYFNILLKYRSTVQYLITICHLSCLLDIFARLHCQYYNDHGILVTHPWSTAKHYLKTSFAIDLFAAFPFHLFQIDRILGSKRKVYVHTVLELSSRPWQLHRLIGMINYYESSIQRTSTLLSTIKYSVVVTVLLASITVLIQVITCRVEPDKQGNIEVTCLENSWITHSYFAHDLTPLMIYVKCLYTSVAIFTSTMCGSIYINTTRGTIIFLILFIVSFIVRTMIYARITSQKIGGNVNLTIYQEKVKSFVDFVQTEYIDEDLINDTVQHFQYIWKKTQGGDITQTMKRFHSHLHEDVVYALYGSTLEAAEILQGADIGFYRQLGIHFKVLHFKKDSTIIRCNDVQRLLYIVYRGKVDINVAGSKVCTLNQGGIFGCLERQGITRQTITAIAKVHVEVLVINSNKFHTLIGKFPNFAERLKQTNFFHGEYAESKRRVLFDHDASRTKTVSSASVFKSWFMKLYSKARILIKPDDDWYKIWEYIVCVHLASISSLLLMFYIIMNDNKVPIHVWINALIYIIDIIFYVKIYFGFHLAYVDTESGITIIDLTSIQKKYVRSFGFWLDVTTCIPFELIAKLATGNLLIARYTLSNRMLRFLYLLRYYRHCQHKLNVRTHLRWTYLIYWISINLQFMTCLWWLAACENNQCYKLKSTDREDANNYVESEPGFESILLAYLFTINMFTATGIRDVIPMTITQLLVTILIVALSQFLYISLANEFATMLSIEQFTLSQYEYDIQQLRTYLEGRELSPPIVDKVWQYCLQLWKRQRGEWMPAIITEAPAYLKQDLMTALFGYHLTNHFLFANTHTDFLRQLVAHLQRCVFFPGNYLAETGDMDGSMFFIHDGEVEVYDKHGNNDILRIILRRDQSFGEAQGLFNIPHDQSYKARTVVDALILKREDWQFLLDWFPASHEEIMERAAEHRLKKAPLKTAESQESLLKHSDPDDPFEGNSLDMLV